LLKDEEEEFTTSYRNPLVFGGASAQIPFNVFLPTHRCPMKFAITAIISAFMVLSAPAFAGSHGGGKMDCSKQENKENKACKK